MSVNSKMTAIADKIRQYTSGKEKLTLDDIPGEIDYIAEDRYTLGITDGYTRGQDVGIEQGRQAQYDEFWDRIQNNGNRTDYNNCFNGDAWGMPGIFNPKYPMKPTNAAQMFFRLGVVTGLNAPIIDLRDFDIDFSNCSNFSGAFNYAYGLGAVGKVVNNHNWVQNSVFHSCINLHTIELYEIHVACSFSETFYQCVSLKNITIGGTISKDIDFRYSTKLTHDSLMSIINALKDYSSNPGTQTLIIGNDNIVKLTQEELDSIEDKGWNYA